MSESVIEDVSDEYLTMQSMMWNLKGWYLNRDQYWPAYRDIAVLGIDAQKARESGDVAARTTPLVKMHEVARTWCQHVDAEQKA